VAQARQNKIHVTEIKLEDGKIARGIEDIQETVVMHYQYLFTDPKSKNNIETKEVLEDIPCLITVDENSVLEAQFTEEVLKIIWELEPNKALRLDGLTKYFYKSCWDIIKK